MNKIIVIKCGGSVIDSLTESKTLSQNIRELINSGYQLLLVHGGGPEINRLLKLFQVESEFYHGLRITSEAVAEVAQLALIGNNNTNLVKTLNQGQIKALGLSGSDCNLLLAQYIDEDKLGYVGEVKQVNCDLLNLLLNNKILPVIAPLAVDNEGNTMNINADLAAAAIAAALHANHLILLSDIDGYYAAYPDESSLVTQLRLNEVKQLLAGNTVVSGMIPKLQACSLALEGGVNTVSIINGRGEYRLNEVINKPGTIGTTVTKEEL